MGVVRTIWVVVPLLLSVLASVLLILAYLQQVSSTGFLRSLNFISIRLPAQLLNAPTTVNGQATTLGTIITGGDVQPQYDIGIWNYCTAQGCTAPRPGFYFDPLTVWHLQTSVVSGLLPNEWQDGLRVYSAVSKWLFAAYTVAAVNSAITVLMGALALCGGRLSACCVGLSASITAAFGLAGAVTALTMFNTIKGLLELKLGQYGVHTDINGRTIAFSFIAAGFALLAAIGWLLAMCCSGKSHSKRVYRGPDYDRLMHPDQQAYDMRQMRSGYEPVRV